MIWAYHYRLREKQSMPQGSKWRISSHLPSGNLTYYSYWKWPSRNSGCFPFKIWWIFPVRELLYVYQAGYSPLFPCFPRSSHQSLSKNTKTSSPWCDSPWPSHWWWSSRTGPRPNSGVAVDLMGIWWFNRTISGVLIGFKRCSSLVFHGELMGFNGF